MWLAQVSTDVPPRGAQVELQTVLKCLTSDGLYLTCPAKRNYHHSRQIVSSTFLIIPCDNWHWCEAADPVVLHSALHRIITDTTAVKRKAVKLSLCLTEPYAMEMYGGAVV
jgi:hypothetical protein